MQSEGPSAPVTPLPPLSSQGGYNLESLSESVCMTVQALLGDPAPPLSGPMVPHPRCEGLEAGKAGRARPGLTTPVSPCSALESIQSVRAAQAPHWTSLQQQGQCGLGRVVGSGLGLSVTPTCFLDSAPVLSPSTRSPEGRPSPLLSERPEFKAAASQATAALGALLDELHLHPVPPVRTAVALTSLDAALVLPPDIPHQEGSALKEETQSWARWAEWAWGEG